MLGAWYDEETIKLADWGTAVLYSTQPRKKRSNYSTLAIKILLR